MRSPLRYLAAAALIPLGGAAVLAGVLAGPWSPLALDRADARYLGGDLASALALYGDVADGWHTPATRAEAAERAALVALRLGDATAAAGWLRRAVDLEPEAAGRAALYGQLGALYLEDFGDPVRAAEAYERAAVEISDGVATLAAARCWERAGHPDRARVAYEQAAARLPEGSGRDEAQAGLARVELLLGGLTDAW